MDKEDIINCINNKEAKLIKNFFNLDFSWTDFFKLYKDTKQNNDLRRMSFATLAIDKTEEYTDKLNEIIKVLSAIHPGSFIHSLSIIHFISKYSEHIDEIDIQDAINFRELFFEENDKKVPNKIDKQNFVGAIHSDDVDGFYIQCDGSVVWNIYYENKTVSHVLQKGDVMFVPKFIKHSVDSLGPRNAISFAFKDAMI